MAQEQDTVVQAGGGGSGTASSYTFVAAQLRTRYLPGGNTEQVYQVTAQTVPSGIYFFHNFRVAVYEKPTQVVDILNGLAESIETWNAVPGVVGLSAVQVIDSQDQFVNMFDVTVDSTSGNSSSVIRVQYPGSYAGQLSVAEFTSAVAQARAQLDAVENA